MIVKLIERIEILDGRNESAGWSCSQFFLKALKRFVISLRCDLHASVRAIAHPARQPKSARHLAYVPAKPYALHATAHEDMQSHLRAPSPACIAVPTM
jgi:hypothetical protein